MKCQALSLLVLECGQSSWSRARLSVLCESGEIPTRALQPKLSYAGWRGRVARSTLAEVNETGDWRIAADFGQTLIPRARQLCGADPFAVELAQTASAFEYATTIDLCLARIPWARFRRTKATVKMLHPLLALRAHLPTGVAITEGKAADVTVLTAPLFEPGAFYVLDRGHTGIARLDPTTQSLAVFVTRGKRGLDYARRVSRRVTGRLGCADAGRTMVALPRPRIRSASSVAEVVAPSTAGWP